MVAAPTIMTSTLKQQLAALQPAPGARKTKGKPSLLWDFRAAADVDLSAIHELGTAGERWLQKLHLNAIVRCA